MKPGCHFMRFPIHISFHCLPCLPLDPLFSCSDKHWVFDWDLTPPPKPFSPTFLILYVRSTLLIICCYNMKTKWLKSSARSPFCQGELLYMYHDQLLEMNRPKAGLRPAGPRWIVGRVQLSWVHFSRLASRLRRSAQTFLVQNPPPQRANTDPLWLKHCD